MEVHRCRTSADFLPRRSQEDDILNVVTNTIVMVVSLMDSGALVAEDLISFPFGKMTCVDTSQSATRPKLGYRETEGEVRRKKRKPSKATNERYTTPERFYLRLALF